MACGVVSMSTKPPRRYTAALTSGPLHHMLSFALGPGRLGRERLARDHDHQDRAFARLQAATALMCV
eukprot:4014096-Amphidinium_carterae.1